jgi:hypothetical protein
MARVPVIKLDELRRVELRPHQLLFHGLFGLAGRITQTLGQTLAELITTRTVQSAALVLQIQFVDHPICLARTLQVAGF